jgi:two-component system sensor histidine kinase CpxA
MLWFLVNLGVVALAGFLLLGYGGKAGVESFLAGQAKPRLTALAAAVTGELRASPRDRWPEVLARLGDAFGVTLGLTRPDGQAIAPDGFALPVDVRQRMAAAPGPGPLPPGPPFPRTGGRWHGEAAPGPPDRSPGGDRIRRAEARLLFFAKSGGKPAYWAALAIHGMPSERDPGPGFGTPAVLLVGLPTLAAGGLVTDPAMLAAVIAGTILVSALIWWPFVRAVNRRLGEMNRATASLADGEFDVSLRPGNVRELAALAESIESMAARLKAHVTGQRRFLGDVAHELCAPLARLEMGLGILENRLEDTSGARDALAGAREETREIAGLVEELLSFSKAALTRGTAALEAVPLRAALADAAAREQIPDVKMDIDAGLTVMANPAMLRRALSNIFRNARQHATDGPVEATASVEGDEVVLTIADSGPGVPEEMLDRLFEPFFRPDASRARETGGTGLGLAIVKSCILACGGSVQLFNRQPHGLAARIRLALASSCVPCEEKE